MVERVARGRITVPAAAALGAVSAGLLAASPALAGGRDTTLQMRVEVVEPCRIRVLPGGTLDQSCGGGQLPTQISMDDLVADFNARAGAHFGSFPAPAPPLVPPLPATIVAPATLTFDAQARAAGQRANEVALGIVERVRHITLVF